MRGLERTDICMVALDQQSRAVATASSYCMHHSSRRYAKDVFWGMLTTHPERRGEKIRLILGAQAIVHKWERKQARCFMLLPFVKQTNGPPFGRISDLRVSVVDRHLSFLRCPHVEEE